MNLQRELEARFTPANHQRRPRPKGWRFKVNGSWSCHGTKKSALESQRDYMRAGETVECVQPYYR